MQSDEMHREAIYLLMAEAAAPFVPACCTVIVLEQGEAHVQVNLPDSDDPQLVYEAGQKAMYALASFLERYRPLVESTAERKAQQS
jgi:hypothetical protein